MQLRDDTVVDMTCGLIIKINYLIKEKHKAKTTTKETAEITEDMGAKTVQRVKKNWKCLIRHSPDEDRCQADEPRGVPNHGADVGGNVLSTERAQSL